MARIVVIGGIESTFRNAQVLYELGEEIVMFYTRGPRSRGWEGVALIDATRYGFAARVPTTAVNGNINDHAAEIASFKPDFIYSLGWQQIYKRALLAVAPVIGIHESLLPEGAGAVPIANVILHDRPVTGVSLFWLDGGMDTGPLIGQLKLKGDPRRATASELYEEAMALEAQLLRMFVPRIDDGTAPAIPQDTAKRTAYGKVNWADWPSGRVARARTYPYA